LPSLGSVLTGAGLRLRIAGALVTTGEAAATTWIDLLESARFSEQRLDVVIR
jgi:hypothetical protein